MTPHQAALRFVASHREITVTLAGCSAKEHVDDAVRAVEHLEERPAEDIVSHYQNAGIALNNLCTGCGYCKGCPKQIEIPKLMDAYNHMLLTKKESRILSRLSDHWDIDPLQAAKCIACEKCEKQCTQHLPIIERLKEISELVMKQA